MAPPVLPAGSLGGLQGTSTAGMQHTGQQLLEHAVRQANAEITTDPTWGPETCCLLYELGSAEIEKAAARGFVAKWGLMFYLAGEVAAAQVWRIRDAACPDWEEIVRVTGDLVKHGRLFRLVAAVDTTLNQGTRGTKT